VDIHINGINLYYEKKGKGKPMYVLHGGPGLDHRYFNRSLAGLESIRELYYIDLRGHGRSSKSDKKSYTIDSFTEDIESMRRELGHETIEIFGHSMGGFVAMLYALRYASCLDTLILVGVPPKEGKIKGNYFLKAKLICLNLKYYLKYKIDRILDKDALARDILLMSWPIYIPEKMLPEYSKYIHSLQDLEIFFDMQQELLEFDISNELENIQQPTLVVFGEKDIFLNSGRDLKIIKHSRFSIIPSTMHMPFLEDEYFFNMVVMDFLTGKIM
jgi:proline iminopeptidase